MTTVFADTAALPTSAGLFVDHMPAGLKQAYDTIVLASRVDEASDVDENTLVVCCDWLAWQELIDNGIDAVHYQCLWSEHDFSDLQTDLFLRANDWLGRDGEDLTVFQGVSLGRLFVKELSLVLLECRRLNESLRGLVERFKPSTIKLRSFYTERSLITHAERLAVLEKLAQDIGITLIDQTAGDTRYDDLSPENRAYGIDLAPVDQRLSWAARVFEAVTVMAGRVRGFWTSRGRILFLTTQLNSLPLFEAHRMADPAAMIIARNYPGKKNVGRLLKNIWRGMIPISMPAMGLSAADTAIVEDIEDTLRNHLESHPEPAVSAIAPFIERHLIEEGRLRDCARKVVIYSALLDREKPSALITDGLQNVVANICMELASKRGIRNAVTWHGPYFDDMKMDVFGSDPRRTALADVCLTWGAQQEHYLEAVNATCRPVRTGSPIAQAARHGARAGTSSKGAKRIMLLQYSVTPYDTRWPHANQYPLLGALAVRIRDAFPDAELRIKLHPGPPKVSYFKRVLARFGVDADVRQDGPFTEHLDWADLVIGPIHSGAMLEALYAEKPFIPLLFKPTTIAATYAEKIEAAGTIERFSEMLIRPEKPRHEAFRSYALSESEIENPSRAVWSTLTALCGEQGQ